MPRCILDLPGPIPETIAAFLGPAARKSLRLTCKEARQLVDRTVHSATVDVGNVRVLCGPWRPLHTTFPHLRHLAVCLRSTGAIAWDAPLQSAAPANADPNGSHSGGAAAATAGGAAGGGRGSCISQGPAAAAASFSLRLLRDSVPKLRQLRSLDLTQCYIDPKVWTALCSAGAGAAADGDGCGGGGGGGGLPRGLEVYLNPAAALVFPGRTWGERLGAMLRQLAAVQPYIRVRVAACGSSGGGGGALGVGLSGFVGGAAASPGGVGAACWCDVDGAPGVMQLADMPYISELPVCIWSRVPSEPDWLSPLAGLTRLKRLHLSSAAAPGGHGHAWLGGLSALPSLRELTLGLLESPLHLAELAPLSACTALTALSVGALAVAAAQPPAHAAALGGALMDYGVMPLPLVGGGAAAGAGGGGGGGGDSSDGANITPLPGIRRLEIRSCLTAGPLPLAAVFPRAASVSMCACTVGGGGGGRGGGAGGGPGGRVQCGHALESLLPPSVAPAPALALSNAQHPQPRLLPLLPAHPQRQQHQQQQHQQQQQQQHREVSRLQQPVSGGSVPLPRPPAASAMAAAATAATAAEGGLRSLELVQRETSAITLGPALDSTGRVPLPGTALLGQLQSLEHLQLTAWRLPGGQLPALLAAAQHLPRLRRLTLRCCDGQSFGWRASRLAYLGQGLGLGPLAGLQLRAVRHLEVLGAPSLQLLEQLVLAVRLPALQRLELHGVQHWEDGAFQRILGGPCRDSGACLGPPRTLQEREGGGCGRGGRAGGGAPRAAPRVLISVAAAAAAAKPRTCGSCTAIDVVLPYSKQQQQQQVEPPTAGSTPIVEGSQGTSRCAACLVRPGGTPSPSSSSSSGKAEEDDAGEGEGCGYCDSRRPQRPFIDSGCGGGDDAAAERCLPVNSCRRWPHLSYIAVHGCVGASFAPLRRQVLAAGLGPGLELDWLPYTQAQGRESWAEVVMGCGRGAGREGPQDADCDDQWR